MGISVIFHRLFTALKVARTAFSLSHLADDRLAAAGIRRGEIRQHARALVTYEYDGL